MGGNIKNYYFNKLDVKLSNSEYYDFYLANDEYPIEVWDGIITGDTLIVEFDFDNQYIYDGGDFSATTIYSLSTWEDAVNTGVTLNNIGLTGLDNGFIPFEKDPLDYGNTGLCETLTGTTLQIVSGETSLFLTPVSGYTENYIYPIEILASPVVGRYAQLCGGFYQGFYKLDNNTYQVLPNRFAEGWTTEFWLNKSNSACSGYTGTTLNDDYSGNSGFFFYLGARAENKFWNVFGGLNSGATSGVTSGCTSACTSACTYWCTTVKESGVTTTSGYPLDPPPLTITEITNKFLIYSRADGSRCGSCVTGGTRGKTISNFTGGSITLTSTTMTVTDERNKFTFFSRADGTRCGYCGTGGTRGTTICNYSGDSQPLLELDYEHDLVRYTNAFGLRIKDDGSVGYRAIRFTCVTATTSAETTISSGITVEESYSASGMVSTDEWTHIAVKFRPYVVYDDCKLQERGPRNGILYFYVNGRLKHTVDDFEEIIPKRLNEWHEKQEGVPFNISLGGGSQGLLESLTFDGQDPSDLGLPIETYFAGTFIGGISKFRIYDEPLNWCEIKNNYEYELNIFNDNLLASNYILAENGNFLCQEDRSLLGLE